MNATKSEKKYQALRLYHSRNSLLVDMKALFRVVSVAASSEYSQHEQVSAVLGTRNRLAELARYATSRYGARARALGRYSRTPNPRTRAEDAAAFVTAFRGQRSWERFGSLIAKGDRTAPPRPGSSKGKIERTGYHGWERVNRALDQLFGALDRLMAVGGRQRDLVAEKASLVRAALTFGAKTSRHRSKP